MSPRIVEYASCHTHRWSEGQLWVTEVDLFQRLLLQQQKVHNQRNVPINGRHPLDQPVGSHPYFSSPNVGAVLPKFGYSFTSVVLFLAVGLLCPLKPLSFLFAGPTAGLRAADDAAAPPPRSFHAEAAGFPAATCSASVRPQVLPREPHAPKRPRPAEGAERPWLIWQLPFRWVSPPS